MTSESTDTALTAWRRGVAGVLAKARRADAASFGDTPERELDTTTYDGVTIPALRTRADELPEDPLPGVAPFTRGAEADRDPTVGWHVRARHGLGGPGDEAPAEVNRRVLADLENGVTSVWLTLGADGPDALEEALAEVFVDLAPVVLEAGEHTPAAAAAFHALVERRGLDPAEVDVSLGADPLTNQVRTGDARLHEAVTLTTDLLDRRSGGRAVTLDGRVFHDAGASDAQELGWTVAAGLDVVRALVAGGVDVADALAQVELRHAATDDQFATLAKLRAGRRLWARVAEVVGAPQAGAVRQHAVTSSAMTTQRDPWVNLLRATVAAFGAGVGGAHAVTVLPFDAALPGGAPGVSTGFAARIARNTQLLLLEESHLGRVLDPGAGSWHVESLTDDLAHAAWSHLQEVEAAGGALAAVASGLVAQRCAETRARRDDDVDHRRAAITGVSQFPNLDDPAPGPAGDPADPGALPVHRYAERYEALRDRADAHAAATGTRPTVLLAPLGPLAEHAARTGFVTTLLAAGGIAAHDPGPDATVEELAATGHLAVVVVCGSEKRYATEAAGTITALRGAGAGRVLLAGARLDGDTQPDGNLSAGTDAVAALTDLLDHLGVS
ncbi:methylmalonyl-CoA mutase small subunit [Rhodococcus aerolatus]